MPEPASADTITMTFDGVMDLSPFGGPSDSVFVGNVTWDPSTEPDAFFPEEAARHLLDGSPSSVTARLSINSIDYSGRIEPFSRFEHGPWDLFLQLFFSPVLDLDGGPAVDVDNVYLWLWTDGPPVFGSIDTLPDDLSFLRRLDHRAFGFVSFESEVAAYADTLQVVPEPSLWTLFMLGTSVAYLRRRKK